MQKVGGAMEDGKATSLRCPNCARGSAQSRGYTGGLPHWGYLLQMFLQSAFPIDISALAAGLVFILRESHTSNYVKAES